MGNVSALHYSLDDGDTSAQTRLLTLLTINRFAAYTVLCTSDVRGKRGPSDAEFLGEFRCSFFRATLFVGFLHRV